MGKSLFISIAIFIAVLSFLPASALPQIEEGSRALGMIQEVLQAQFSKLRSVKFDSDSTLTLSNEYLSAYPQYKDRSAITSHFQFITTGQKYYYKDKAVEPSGKINSDIEGCFDGKDTLTLIKANTSIMVVRHEFIRQMHGAFAAKSLVFLPFCFLPKDYDGEGYSVITLADLQSVDFWKALAQRITKIETAGISPNRTVKISFKSDQGYTDDVVFIETNGWNPQSVTRTEDKIGKRFEIKVNSYACLKQGTSSYWYPNSVKVTYYGINSKKFFDSDLTLTSFAVNQDFSDECFAIDPSLADIIEDKDNNVRIDVPR